MGIFRQFPYSNFHEMNLDWLLNTWKEFSAQFDVWQKSVDETIKEFKEYLESIPFDEYVNEVLTEWLNDGTIESIIRSFIMPQREIIMARELRYISTPANSLGGQSCFYYDPFIYVTGETATGQAIHKCNLNGDVVESHTYSDLGHANSIAINNDTIYVADGASAKVTVLDLNSWQITGVITPSEFDNIWSVTAFDNHVYLLGSDINAPSSIMLFAEIDANNDVEVKLSIPNPPNTIRQNMCVKGSSIYIIFNEANMIYEYDINAGNMISALYIPDGDGYYPTGEPEDLFVMNNAIYLVGTSYYRYDYTYPANSVVQLFKTNTDGTTIVQSQNEYSYYNSEARLVLLVDDTQTPEKNPYNNFTTLEEACLIANYHRTADIECAHIDSATVHLLNGNYRITLAGGNRVINRLWCENSTLYMQAVVQLHNARLTRVNAIFHNLALYEDFNASFSQVCFEYASLANLATISGQNVDWTFKYLTQVSASLAVTGSSKNGVHIFSGAINNLLLLAKLNGGGGPFIGYNTGGIIFVMSTSMVTNQTINQTVGSMTVTYSSGVFGGSITSSNLIEIKQLASS